MSGESDALFKQYERVAEDWRFQHRLIWEIPSVAVAILTGILIITYTQYNNLESYIRISLLAASAVLLLALTIALIKHRFGADLRTQFIYELEKKIGIEILPLETDKALKWLSNHNQVITGGPLIRVILKWNISAEIMLVYLVFSSFLLLSALATYEIICAVL